MRLRIIKYHSVSRKYFVVSALVYRKTLFFYPNKCWCLFSVWSVRDYLCWRNIKGMYFQSEFTFHSSDQFFISISKDLINGPLRSKISLSTISRCCMDIQDASFENFVFPNRDCYFLFRGDERTTDQQDARLQPSDTYIIPSQPSRRGKAPEVSHRTNTHVLITFGLQVKLRSSRFYACSCFVYSYTSFIYINSSLSRTVLKIKLSS